MLPLKRFLSNLFGFSRNPRDQDSSGSSDRANQRNTPMATKGKDKRAARIDDGLHRVQSGPSMKRQRVHKSLTEEKVQASVEDLFEDVFGGSEGPPSRRVIGSPTACNAAIPPPPVLLPPAVHHHSSLDMDDRCAPLLPCQAPASPSMARSTPDPVHVPLEPMDIIVISDDEDSEATPPAEIPFIASACPPASVLPPTPKARHIPEPLIPAVDLSHVEHYAKQRRFKRPLLRYYFEFKLKHLHHHFDDIVFTDGSYGNRNRGGGCGVYFGPNDPRNRSLPLDKKVVTSSCDCEHIAAICAIQLCKKDASVLICSDHAGVVQNANNLKVKDKYSKMLKTVVARRPGLTAFMYVPGHAFVLGNMMADCYAGKAMNNETKLRNFSLKC